MKQTPVQWLYDQIGDNAPHDYAAQIASYLEEAMKMETEQIPELSDDEIYDIAYNELHPLVRKYTIDTFISGMKAYRKQLKQRQ